MQNGIEVVMNVLDFPCMYTHRVQQKGTTVDFAIYLMIGKSQDHERLEFRSSIESQQGPRDKTSKVTSDSRNLT